MRTVVISGATSGIGRALVEEFAKDCIVFAGYRNENYLDDLQAISGNVRPFFMNMEDKASIAKASAYIKSETNSIDTLINVAGCVVAGAIENIDIDRIRYQFEVNTFGHLDFAQHILPLIKDNGKIINISSMASFGIFPFISPYCASKRALDILFNALQIETHKNIKVISIKPGVIATPLWSKSVEINKNEIKANNGFDKEMKFLAENALKNESRGLDVEKVVKLITKVDALRNPKASYTISLDAKLSEIFALLPQTLINKMMRYGLRYRIRH